MTGMALMKVISRKMLSLMTDSISMMIMAIAADM
jgi:hypothetical protein